MYLMNDFALHIFFGYIYINEMKKMCVRVYVRVPEFVTIFLFNFGYFHCSPIPYPTLTPHTLQ